MAQKEIDVVAHLVKQDVKEHANRGHFQHQPEKINKDGAPPKTHWWSELLKERAEAEDRERKLKNKEIMADALIEKAKTGDVAALKEFGDRVQGKSPQSLGTIDPDGSFKEQSLTISFK